MNEWLMQRYQNLLKKFHWDTKKWMNGWIIYAIDTNKVQVKHTTLLVKNWVKSIEDPSISVAHKESMLDWITIILGGAKNNVYPIF